MERMRESLRLIYDYKTTYGDDDDDDDDDKYIKTKIKIYKDNINTNFYNKKGSKKVRI